MLSIEKKFGKTCSFYHINEQQKLVKEPEIPSYGNGPDPLRDVANLFQDPIKQELAQACLDARIYYIDKKKEKSEIKIKWDDCFSAKEILGQSVVLASFVGASIMKCFSAFCMSSYDINSLLPKEKKIKKHVFQILQLDNRKFLVDLSVRQWIKDGLRLRKEEAEIFDALLKYGFVECTKKVKEIWLDFFYSRIEFEETVELEWIIKRGLSKNQ